MIKMQHHPVQFVLAIFKDLFFPDHKTDTTILNRPKEKCKHSQRYNNTSR